MSHDSLGQPDLNAIPSVWLFHHSEVYRKAFKNVQQSSQKLPHVTKTRKMSSAGVLIFETSRLHTWRRRLKILNESMWGPYEHGSTNDFICDFNVVSDVCVSGLYVRRHQIRLSIRVSLHTRLLSVHLKVKYDFNSFIRFNAAGTKNTTCLQWSFCMMKLEMFY